MIFDCGSTRLLTHVIRASDLKRQLGSHGEEFEALRENELSCRRLTGAVLTVAGEEKCHT